MKPKRAPPPPPPMEPIPYRACPMNALDMLAGVLFGSSLTIVAFVVFKVIP